MADTITMVKDGQAADVPIAQYGAAIAKGAKPAVLMRGQDGSEAWIPHDQIGAGMKAGAKIVQQSENQAPTQFEQQRSQRQGFAIPALKAAGNMALGALTSPAPAMNPNPAIGAQIGSQIASDDAMRQSEGRSGGYRGIAAAASALGIPTRGMEEAANRGDTASVAGQAFGTALPAALAPLLAKRGIQAENTSAPAKGSGELITEGVNPAPKNAQFEPNLQRNLAAIKQTALEKNIPVNGREGLLDATLQTRQGVIDKLSQALEPHRGVEIDVRTEVPNFKGWMSGGTRPYTTLGALEERLNQINSTLEPKYEKGRLVSQASISAQDAAALNSEAASIRDTLYGKLKELNPNVDVAGLRAQSGQLKQLADSIANSIRGERYQGNLGLKNNPPKSTTEAFGRTVGFLADKVLGNRSDAKVNQGFRNIVQDRPQYIGSLAQKIAQRSAESIGDNTE